MIHYTDRIAALVHDIVERVPPLGFLDPNGILVFARSGRSGTAGPFATCHCLNLPESDPGYYFWRDRSSGRMTRRSEWFVVRSPEIRVGSSRVNHMLSFALPRFCDQTLTGSRKHRHYPGEPPWIAKLDTIVHELYHIDPHSPGIRRLVRSDGVASDRCHTPEFFEEVARLVRLYLDSHPSPSVYDFLRHDFGQLRSRFGSVVGTTFRTYPSFPRPYQHRLDPQPPGPRVRIVPLPGRAQPARYTERDLQVREFGV